MPVESDLPPDKLAGAEGLSQGRSYENDWMWDLNSSLERSFDT